MKEYFPKPVGFIYGYEPSGHQIAAIAVSEFLPGDIVKPNFFSLSKIFPKASNVLVRSYLEVLQKTPLLWDYLYDNQLLSMAYYNLGIKMPEFYVNHIQKILIRYAVTTIVSTHAFSSMITARENLKIKIHNNFAIITDIYAHCFWPKTLDKYFVPLYETYKTLRENGVDAEKIEVSGMPLRKEFYQEYNKENIKKKLKLDNSPTFLITGGSKGIGEIMEIIDVLKSLHKKVNIIVFCGSNKKLKKSLKKIKYASNARLYPLDYQKNPAIYYAVSDCVIGKSGGITVFETAAFKKPFIIYSPLPGQEEKNAKFLVRHHCALNPDNAKELRSIIDAYFYNHQLFEKLSSNISKLHRKDASLKIANNIINSI
jgi:processive 1,2-diacylglycerol beta-glucosyltransferase